MATITATYTVQCSSLQEWESAMQYFLESPDLTNTSGDSDTLTISGTLVTTNWTPPET